MEETPLRLSKPTSYNAVSPICIRCRTQRTIDDGESPHFCGSCYDKYSKICMLCNVRFDCNACPVCPKNLFTCEQCSIKIAEKNVAVRCRKCSRYMGAKCHDVRGVRNNKCCTCNYFASCRQCNKRTLKCQYCHRALCDSHIENTCCRYKYFLWFRILTRICR